jgi:DNA-binding response OmpR family regulator
MARILVIDDEHSIRVLLAAALSRESHSVVTAADGDEGIEKFRSETFDLVITDIRMPGLTGLEVIGVLRGLQPAIRIIIMGGGGSVPPMMPELYARQVGADCALVKPFGIEQLRDRVSTLLAGETPA